MKIIKKINNNFALGLDSNGREVILYGKGIGFYEMPYELTDLSLIDRSYYDIDKRFYGLLSEIPENIFHLCSKVVRQAHIQLNMELNPNLLFILADHINFAIQRKKKNMYLPMPNLYDISNDYPIETKIARWALVLIKKELNVSLPVSEVDCIAIHLINAKKGKVEVSVDLSKEVIYKTTKIIEAFFAIKLDKKSFDFYRFSNHIKYLVKRKLEKTEYKDINLNLYDHMIEEYPKSYECAVKIDEYVQEKFGEGYSKEELLYLMLHINKLCYKSEL